MNYELAKQLKGAGFRRKGFSDEEIHALTGDDTTEGDIVRSIMLTDLEELIEACPKESPKDSTETLTLVWNYEGYWIAGYEAYESWSYLTKGPTPLIAIANLFLALKK